MSLAPSTALSLHATPEQSGEDHLNMGHVSVQPKDVGASQEHRAPLAQTA